MLSNFHTHTVFCDGKDTPEEMILTAIEMGFDSLGFSGHGYMDFDQSYCMLDTEGYLDTLRKFKEKYKDKIEIYAGVEEDAYCPVDRDRFDYIIGSCHYVVKNGVYYPLDCSMDGFKNALGVFDNDHLTMADSYYSYFCDYLKRRRPDIVGHFDLITKYDEKMGSLFLSDPDYHKLAEGYIESVADIGCFFEVNTGAIARGHRTTPYPYENLLYILKKHGTELVLTSDCHNAKDLDCSFDTVKAYLKDMGFDHMNTLYGGKFIKYSI